MSENTIYESENRIAPESIADEISKGLEIVDGHAVKAPGDYEDPDQLYDMLIARIRKYHPSTDVSMIEKAYETAQKAHGDQCRKSGEPYIVHPLWVAIILANLEMDKETIAAGMLHDVVEDTSVSEEKIKKDFGEEVALLVDGVTKLGRLSYSSDKLEVQAENLRKMFLRPHVFQRPHIVQAVCKLYKDDPDILCHGQKQLPQIFCLYLYLIGRVGQLAQLCDTVYKKFNLIAEFLPDLLRGHDSILHHIMKESGHDRFLVKLQIRQDDSDTQRMDNIRLP